MEVEEGKTLLQACLESGIYIPNLCFLDEMKNPPASCRLCFVEIEGENKPTVSCKVEPREGMVIRTDTAAVRQLPCLCGGLSGKRYFYQGLGVRG